VDQVQCYLVEHAEKFLAEHGRTMIGWDEILKNNLRSTSTVISYRGQRGGIEAANRGYDVVMSPGEILYFDWYQADPHTQPRAMGGFSPIRKMYGFHPVPDTPAKAADNESIIRGEFVSPDSVEYIYDGGKEHVIGVQGCTWTEFIETEKHLEYMIFPRLLAVSELAWTPRERREWNDFRRRINVHVSLLHARGINAFPLSDDVVITAQMLSEGKKARVTLDTEKYPAEVRYTLDGTAPVPGSDLYDGPFVVKAGTTVRAALFVAGRMEGTMTELYVDARRNVDNYYTYLNTPEVYASTDR
jgi:N-acetyl-beta-hexosaminidase